MTLVAGHTFAGVGTDQRCTDEACKRWWTEIMDCGDGDVGKPNLAHVGDLSAFELAQIREKRKQELRFWDAVEATGGWVTSGGTR